MNWWIVCCGMVEWWKTFCLISIRIPIQRFLPSQISDVMLGLLHRINIDTNFGKVKMNWFSWSFHQKCSKVTLNSIFRHPKKPNIILKIYFDFFKKLILPCTAKRINYYTEVWSNCKRKFRLTQGDWLILVNTNFCESKKMTFWEQYFVQIDSFCLDFL